MKQRRDALGRFMPVQKRDAKGRFMPMAARKTKKKSLEKEHLAWYNKHKEDMAKVVRDASEALNTVGEVKRLIYCCAFNMYSKGFVVERGHMSGYVCHAPIKTYNWYALLERPPGNIAWAEQFYDYYNWLINESPYAYLWINTDAEQACHEGFVSFPDLCSGGEFLAAMQAFRVPYEYEETVVMWRKFVESGVDKTYAYWLVQQFDWAKDGQFYSRVSSGHRPFKGIDSVVDGAVASVMSLKILAGAKEYASYGSDDYNANFGSIDLVYYGFKFDWRGEPNKAKKHTFEKLSKFLRNGDEDEGKNYNIFKKKPNKDIKKAPYKVDDLLSVSEKIKQFFLS